MNEFLKKKKGQKRRNLLSHPRPLFLPPKEIFFYQSELAKKISLPLKKKKKSVKFGRIIFTSLARLPGGLDFRKTLRKPELLIFFFSLIPPVPFGRGSLLAGYGLGIPTFSP